MVVICSIIVISQLVRLSEVLVTFGLSLENIFLPFLYIILPFISITIPIAYLFAVVLCFGRLSADGEYAALLAAGFPLRRSARTVLATGLVLYAIGVMAAMNLESWGRREMIQFLYRKTQTELDNLVKYKLQPGVFLENFLGYVLYTEKIAPSRTNFENILIAPGNDAKNSNFFVAAPSGSIVGTVETGELRLKLERGMAYSRKPNSDKISLTQFHHAEIDLLRVFQEQILGPDNKEDDFRSYRPQELRQYIRNLKAQTTPDLALIRRASYLYHQRIASPFAAITFALFGMVLGVSDPRRGKSLAYVGAIVTIIVGYVILMGCKWLAENAYVPVLMGAWLPNFSIGIVGLFLVYQKNRLPPSESTLDWHNIPFIRRSRRRHQGRETSPSLKKP